jgi:hypothetical protein
MLKISGNQKKVKKVAKKFCRNKKKQYFCSPFRKKRSGVIKSGNGKEKTGVRGAI